MADAKLVIDVVVNSAKAQAELAKTSGAAGGFGKGLSKLVAPAAAVTAAVAGFAAVSLKAASDTQQAFGGLDAVFGANAAQVKAWANSAATSTGLAASEYATFAAQIGAQLKNAGVPADQLGVKTDNLIKLGADLAATYGGTAADAVGALSAALRGEADPAERYGLALNQTAVNAQLAATGQDKLTGEALRGAKIQAVMAMATKQAGGAIGQFSREATSAAGATEIARAQWENAKSALGTALLPAAAAVAGVLGQLATVLQNNSGAAQVVVAVIATLAAGVLILTAAQWAYNAALAANPIGLVVVAVVALIAGFVALYKTNETFRNAVNAVGNAVKTAFAAIGAAAAAVGRAFVAGFNIARAAITNVVTWVRTVVAVVQLTAAMIGTYFAGGFAIVAATVRTAIAAVTVAIRTIIGVVAAVVAFIAPPFQLAFSLVSALVRLQFAIIAAVIRVFVGLVSNAAAISRFLFTAAFNAVRAVAQVAFGRVAVVIRTVIAVARVVGAAVRAVLAAGFNAARAAASSAMSAVSSAVSRVTAPARAVASAVGSAFRSGFNAARSVAVSVASAIRSAVQRISGPVSAVASVIRSGLGGALNTVRGIAGGVGSALRGAFSSVAGVINAVVGAVQRLIGWLSRIRVPSIKLPGGSSRAAVSSTQLRMASPAGVPRSGRYAAPGAELPPLIINVSGALDAEGVARQLRRILRDSDRRAGGITIRRRAATAGIVNMAGAR